MNSTRRRRSTANTPSYDEEAPVSNPFRPSITGPTSSRTRDGGGVRKVKALLLLPCLACLVLGVIGGRFFFPSHDIKPKDTFKARNPTTHKVNRIKGVRTYDPTSTTARPPTLPPPVTRPKLKEVNVSSSVLPVSDCSCSNATAPQHCCERTIFRAHKFGTILVDTLFDSFRRPTSKHSIAIQQFPKQVDKNSTLPTKNDYRHVLVTRNWFDAIVSGYLYHKAGYECWMNARGEKKRIVRRDDWDSHLSFHSAAQIPYPSRTNRTICSYLVDESEGDGMRVLMDIALSKWYKGVVPYWKLVHERNETLPRSLFVCYEDLVDPFQQEQVFHQALDWMFPAGEAKDVSMPVNMKRTLDEQKRHTIYSGGHSTENDPKQRARLRALVERFDHELFNNTVATSDAIFGCGSGKSA